MTEKTPEHRPRWAVKTEMLGAWLREPGETVSFVRERTVGVVVMKATREEAEGFASGLRAGLQHDGRAAVTRIWVEEAPA